MTVSTLMPAVSRALVTVARLNTPDLGQVTSRCKTRGASIVPFSHDSSMGDRRPGASLLCSAAMPEKQPERCWLFWCRDTRRGTFGLIVRNLKDLPSYPGLQVDDG